MVDYQDPRDISHHTTLGRLGRCLIALVAGRCYAFEAFHHVCSHCFVVPSLGFDSSLAANADRARRKGSRVLGIGVLGEQMMYPQRYPNLGNISTETIRTGINVPTLPYSWLPYSWPISVVLVKTQGGDRTRCQKG